MPQPAPKLEKIKVDKLPSPRPPKLPAECPVVSPERLTAAVGEGAYIPRSPPWPPDSPRRSRNKDSNANVRYAKAERLSRFEEEKERGKKKKKETAAAGKREKKNTKSNAKFVSRAAEAKVRPEPGNAGSGWSPGSGLGAEKGRS